MTPIQLVGLVGMWGLGILGTAIVGVFFLVVTSIVLGIGWYILKNVWGIFFED